MFYVLFIDCFFSILCSIRLTPRGRHQKMAPTSPPTLYHLSATKGKNTFKVKYMACCSHCKQRHGSFLHQRFTMSNFSCCSQKLLRSPRKPTRKISKIPFKVLDAPELQDDFYLNLVDWSSLNVLSVGLGTCVYLWSACTSQVLYSV